MEDVKAIVAVFSSDLLKTVLSQITVRSQAQILSYWQDKSKEWLDAQQFVTKMGKECTKTMAIRLNESGLTYDKLRGIFDEHKADEASFHHHLIEAGVTRKTWRSKLWHHFLKKQSSYSILFLNGFYESHHQLIPIFLLVYSRVREE